MAVIEGTTGGDTLTGTPGDDTIIGHGGEDVLDGFKGDDYIETLGATGLSNVNGQLGDDTLVASVPGAGQVHMRGGGGNDRIVMDLTNTSGHQGHHVYGGLGADTFEFVNAEDAVSPILGRIDDFDFAQDRLMLDGVELDLFDLPDGVDVVMYLGQQWLRIGDSAIYALEGARDGGAERHFSDLPDDIGAMVPVGYVDQKNFVPLPIYEAALPGLTLVEVDGASHNGTAGNDLIEAGKDASVIDGGAGDDVINAGKGADHVTGGPGSDHIAGGMDNDTLLGGAGDDHLWGGSEDDRLEGGDGADVLEGGTGNDILIGDDMAADWPEWMDLG